MEKKVYEEAEREFMAAAGVEEVRLGKIDPPRGTTEEALKAHADEMEKAKDAASHLKNSTFFPMGTTEEGRKIRSGEIGDDNWKHRSKKMRCEGCMFFVLKSSNTSQPEDHLIGRCRESSPTLKGWPAVFSDDWCGSHKLDENKL